MSQPSFVPTYTKIWHTEPTPQISPTRPELSQKGKNVIVTGGGTGIGAQIALSFAAAGASSIGLIGRREEVLQSSKEAIQKAYPDTTVSYLTVDVLDSANVEATFKKFHASFGTLHVLVSNAGFLSTPSPIVSADPADWWMSMQINVLGTFNVIRAFLPLAAQDSTVLNITSGIAHMASNMNGVSAYAASKIANAKMIEYLSNEEPSLHVVNVQPGIVASDINRKSGMPSFDCPELPGNFSVWLASPEARFLNGKFVWVNWDVDELKARQAEIESDPLSLQLTLKGPANPQ